MAMFEGSSWLEPGYLDLDFVHFTTKSLLIQLNYRNKSFKILINFLKCNAPKQYSLAHAAIREV